MGPANFGGNGMFIIPLVMMIVCILVFKLGVFKKRSVNETGNRSFLGNQDTQGESPLEILKRRYAAGEISKSEYEEIKQNL